MVKDCQDRVDSSENGAYNRTLTPFGFQAEERTLWEAPENYFQMSPFMHMLWEMSEWLDTHVLPRPAEGEEPSGPVPPGS